MEWKWNLVIELNRVIRLAAGKEQHVRHEDKSLIPKFNILEQKYAPPMDVKWVAKIKPFKNCNAQTAACMAVCNSLEHE